jgi:hypothetical protein
LKGIPAVAKGLGAVRLVEVDDRGRASAQPSSAASSRSSKFWLVVSDAPADKYGQGEIDRRLSDLEWVGRNALAHEAIVEFFARAGTCLPMKLFTMFSSDARAVEDLEQRRRKIVSLIGRVAGRDEWGVRVQFVPGKTRNAKTRRPRSSTPAKRGSGASYLMRKKATRDEAKELAARASDVVNDLYENLADRAADARRRPAGEVPQAAAPLLLDAAFLVPRSRATVFRRSVARRAQDLSREGYRVELTGPWPPYSFVQD